METKILKVNPRDLKLLEVNARYMKPDEFNLLVENIKRDGTLSSVPFCCYDDDWNLEVLSGNHRVKAAIEAGLEEISVMITEEELTREQKTAIALSHNSISGQDDYAILKQMYESIDSVEFKKYSGLDDETLEMLEKVGNQSMSAIGLDFQVLNVVVLPTELQVAKNIIDEAKKQVKRNTALTLRYEDYDKWLDTLDDVGSALGIKNTATALLAMLSVVEKHMDELKEVWIEEADDKDWVPTSTLFNRTKVRAADGRIIEKALQRMIDRGDVKKSERHKALAIMAQCYIDSLKKG